MENNNVATLVASRGYCIGCGICAGLCPRGALTITTNKRGDTEAVQTGSCAKSCRLCLDVCPFGDHRCDEDTLAREAFAAEQNLGHVKHMGFYLQTFAGYSLDDGQRKAGSSGGMGTWLLERLLTSGVVDAVVCVGKTTDRSLFAFHIASEVEQVRAAAGSAYYPISMAQAIRHVLNDTTGKKYAFVGLPCYLKGLRLAARKLPRLREKIAALVGLVCGHLPNTFYTEYLCRLSGVPREEVRSVQYRKKIAGFPATNYHFQATGEDKTGGMVPCKGRVATAWSQNHFQCNSCNFCDDLFAEVADVTIMDAWLPKYINEQGTSLLVVRRSSLTGMLRSAAQNAELFLEEVSPQDILESQKGALANKTVKLAGRLYASAKNNENHPAKRVSADRRNYRKYLPELVLKKYLQTKTKEIWSQSRGKSLSWYHFQICWAAGLLYAWTLKDRIVNKLVTLRRAR